MSFAPLRSGVFLSALALAPSLAADVRGQEPFPGLDAYVEQAMEEWQVPGLALAVVRNDSVLYTRGYGVRTFRSSAPVDDHTLFEIGSATKPFTATLVAMLVAEGRMRFDERISQYLPGFRMSDAYANSEVTLRDALSHRTGLSRGELMWLGAGVSRDEVIRRVRFQDPTSSFRSRWAYNNVMFVVAGQAAAKASGTAWDDLIRERIFGPLGMVESVPMVLDFAPYANVATPHATVGRDSVVTRRYLNIDGAAPAGSIVSNARDMAQWLRFQLGDGTYGGEELVAGDVLHETHRPQMVIANRPGGTSGSAADSLTHFNTYGLGWFVEDYRGHLHVNHGGNTDGMTTAQGMLPDQRFGVVVLSNMNQAALPGLLTRYLFDRQLGLPVRDWSGEALAARRDRQRDREARTAEEPAESGGDEVPDRRDDTDGTPGDLDSYAGTYADSLYGEAVVSIVDGGLTLERGSWSGPLHHVDGTHFTWMIMPENLLSGMAIEFDVGPDRAVRALSFGLPGDMRWLGRRPEPDRE